MTKTAAGCVRDAVVLGGVVALTLTAASAARSDEELVQGTMAKPLERRSPEYPRDELFRGEEGWVLVSLVVTREGRTRDIVVEDSEGGRAFERSALRAARGWTYEPAKLDGEPVEQCYSQVILTFRLEDSPTGASRSFVRRYRAIAEELQSADPTRAKDDIDALQPKNLYEGAFRALLAASLAAREGDREATLTALRRATVGDGRYLPRGAYQSALVQRFQLEIQAGQLARALRTYRRIDELGLEDATLRPKLDAVAGKIDAAIAGDAALARTGELGPPPESGGLSVWSHTLSRSTVGLENVEGDIDHIELRCDFHRAFSPLKEGIALRIPERWGACTYFVFGSPGARFDLVEYAADLEAP